MYCIYLIYVVAGATLTCLIPRMVVTCMLRIQFSITYTFGVMECSLTYEGSLHVGGQCRPGTMAVSALTPLESLLSILSKLAMEKLASKKEF